MGMKLLIVDDSSVVRRMIERHVKGMTKAEIRTAANGEEGVKMFEEFRPDYVTMDITMPQMDGLSCLDRIMRIAPARILIISALRDKETALTALGRGADAYLCKPFDSDELTEAFQELMEE
jgi:two-component system, chemotaxis family, chemotaxis protein CheY